MPERVVLMAIDGLDWARLREGMSAGRLPEFRKIFEEGAFAEVAVKSTTPGLSGAEGGMMSPVLWTTVATGQYYFQHGVYDFCNAMESIERPPLFESRHVRSPRIWDVLSQYDMSSIVVGYYVTHPASAINGVMVSDMFAEVESHDTVSPAEKCDAMAALLGAASYDEYVRDWGTVGRIDSTDTGVSERNEGIVRKAEREVLQRFTGLTSSEIDAFFDSTNDSRFRRLTDYRLIYPFIRDQRFHRIFTDLIAEEPWSFATVYYRLVDFVSHGFWERGHVFTDDYLRRYGQVVNRAYEWMDQCVGEVRRAMGAEGRLIVLSDHGFEATHRSPDLTACDDISEFAYATHREPAVLMVSGGARRGAVNNITLLDVAPSILDYFGIPQAETLDGGAVPDLLTSGSPRNLPPVNLYPYVASQAAASMTKAEEEIVLRRLAALGYIE